jgi:hypothetical protein
MEMRPTYPSPEPYPHGSREQAPGNDRTGSIARALRLPESYEPWLASLAAAPPGTGRQLPSASEEEEILARLGVGADARADVAATRSQIAGDEALCWLLDRCQGDIAARAGQVDGPRDQLPQLPAGLGAAGRCFPIHLFVTALADAEERHRRLGIPEEVSRATFADLARHIAIHRRVTGLTGVDAPWWMLLHLRSILFECGRLQYELLRIGRGALSRSLWCGADGPGRRGPGFRAGDAAAGIHIPEGPSFTPSACDAADRTARELFDACFPGLGVRIGICTSWLLDDQLTGYLPADSNIVRFQRRFVMVPGWHEGDKAIIQFVFRREDGDIGDVPQETALQRAVTAHLRAGSHWRTRTGWVEL